MASTFHTEAKVDKGSIRVVDVNKHTGGATEVVFLFNPTKLEITATAKYDQPKQAGASGGGASKPQFTGPEPRSMSLELLLDAWIDHDGKPYDLFNAIATLVSWTRPTKGSNTKDKPNPPAVMLSWGQPRKILTEPEFFKMFLKSVKYTYTMFDDKGNPMRATVSVQGQEIPDPPKKGNPTSGGLAGRDSHLVVEGDTLASVAFEYYGVPGYWRGLAQANGIDDPLRVRPGVSLYMPPISEVSKIS